MPHYITQLELDHEFAVYSTIADGLLTQPMGPKEMKAWLVDNGYTAWLVNDNSDLDGRGYDDAMLKHIIDERERTKFYMYWHPQGFQYVKLDDAYFVLPRSLWRNGN